MVWAGLPRPGKKNQAQLGSRTRLIITSQQKRQRLSPNQLITGYIGQALEDKTNKAHWVQDSQQKEKQRD